MKHSGFFFQKLLWAFLLIMAFFSVGCVGQKREVKIGSGGKTGTFRTRKGASDIGKSGQPDLFG